MGQASNDDTKLETVPLWIDGAPYSSPDVTKFAVFSAKEGRNVYWAQSATAAIAEKAADSAQRALPEWQKNFSAAARRDILGRFAALLELRQQELVDAQIKETSCSETWARFNVAYSAGMIKEIAARVTTACTGELPPMAASGTFGMVVRQPIGVVLLIAP